MKRLRVFDTVQKRWWWRDFSEGGGGQQIIKMELTAAEIAPYWDTNYLQAAVPIDDVEPNSLIQRIWETDNTLDEGLELGHLGMYLPNSTATDIGDFGNYYDGAIGGVNSDSLYGHGLTRGTNDAFLKEGSKAYVIFGGDAAPTVGETTIWLLIAS